MHEKIIAGGIVSLANGTIRMENSIEKMALSVNMQMGINAGV